MSQKRSIRKDHTQRQWTDKDVLTLLCTLNDNIEEIRPKFLEEEKKGVDLAAHLLSKAIGDHCSVSCVVSKIKVIWRHCRPSSAHTLVSPSPMYIFGAWTRTLPLLDILYPGMLEKIAFRTRTRQIARMLLDYQGLQATVLQHEDEDDDDDDDDDTEDKEANTHPIECICGFAHYASNCVHCAKCPSWQHIWCYYDDDDVDAPPDLHTCQKCTRSCEHARMTDKLEEIDLGRDGKTILDSKSRILRLVGSLTLHHDAIQLRLDLSNVVYQHGIGDSEVNSRMMFITSGIRTISHSAAGNDFEFCAHSISDSSIGISSYKVESSSTDCFLSLRAAISSAIWTRSFDSPNVLRSTKGLYKALIEQYQDVLMLPDGATLRDIDQKAWTRLFRSRPDVLEPSIGIEAKMLARDVLCMLSAIIQRSKSLSDNRPLQTADDWIQHTHNGVARFHAFVELFRQGIWLKHMLRLSEYCYELYFPAESESWFMSTDLEDQGRKIKYCFAPAIVEYAPQVFGIAKHDISVFCERENIVHATHEQRKKGRIVCLAVGIFFEYKEEQSIPA